MEVKAERKAVGATDNGWPKLSREDLLISPEVIIHFFDEAFDLV